MQTAPRGGSFMPSTSRMAPRARFTQRSSHYSSGCPRRRGAASFPTSANTASDRRAFHVFAASSYLRDGTLTVPWEAHPYTRALPITMLTALSFRLFGESEASARLLFALANVVFIVVAYRIIRRLFSRTVALVFVIESSLSILSIQMSRECRMYRVQLGTS